MKPSEFITSAHALLTDRARLAIMALLAASDEPVDFNTALSELGLTRGNLSTHIVKLEEAKFVKVHKEFVGKKPRTTYECTAAGRKEIKTYLAQIKSLLQVKSGRAS